MADIAKPLVAADCPRCGQHKVTFDVLESWPVIDNYHHEIFVVCRACGQPSTGLVDATSNNHQAISAYSGGFINRDYPFKKWVFNVPDLRSAPEHIPEDIERAFTEGAKSVAIGCYNAASAMFRLSLDLATKPLLPSATEPDPKPSKRERYNLGPRIDWLVAHGKLPAAIGDLAHHVRLDGNDGAHDGTLGEADANDLIDFTVVILERQYTEPERLRLAKARQTARRGGATEAE